MTLSTSFRPKLVLSANFLGLGRGDIGVFLDLPQVGVSITQVREVNSKCEKSSLNLTNIVDKILDGNLTHIVPTAAIRLGIEEEWVVPGFSTHGPEIELLSTQFPLPTFCLSYDADQKALVTPTPLISDIIAGINSGEKKGDGARLENPLKISECFRSLMWLPALLALFSSMWII